MNAGGAENGDCAPLAGFWTLIRIGGVVRHGLTLPSTDKHLLKSSKSRGKMNFFEKKFQIGDELILDFWAKFCYA